MSGRKRRHIAPQYEAPPGEEGHTRVKQEKVDPSDSSSSSCAGHHQATPEQSLSGVPGILSHQMPDGEAFNYMTSSPVLHPNHAHLYQRPAPLSQGPSPVHRLQHFSQAQPFPYQQHGSPPFPSALPFPPQSWFYASPPPHCINQPIRITGGGETFGGLIASPSLDQPLHMQPISSSGGASFGGIYPGMTVKQEGGGRGGGSCDPVRVKQEIEEDLRCSMLRDAGDYDRNDEVKVKTEVKVKAEGGEGGEGGEEGKWEPLKWREQLDNIIKMREKRDAPVDWSGCHVLAASDVAPEVRRYQVLVSLMLSSQTKDEIVGRAMRKLRNHGLTIDNILDTPQEIVAQLILPVGFWNKKAEYIKRTTQILKDKYNYDIPNDMKGLTSLPGIGPKMSHLIMDVAWNSVTGIAVDTHVHRISHRLGWMRKPTKNPEVTRAALEHWLPQSEWRELNWLMVGFGQQICHPLRPECAKCLNKDICPSAFPSPPSTPKRKASSSSSASPSPRVKAKTPKAPRRPSAAAKKQSSKLLKADPESGLNSSSVGLGSVPPDVESVSDSGTDSVPVAPTTPLKHRPVAATRMRLSDSFNALPHHDDGTSP